jgi:hypothetical protein
MSRTVANDLPSDLTIRVDDHVFYLHKVMNDSSPFIVTKPLGISA